MAITNNVDISDAKYDRQFRNESKSFVSTVGNISSFITVPAGEVWQLQTLRALNGESTARDIEFVLTDGDGTTHVTLSNGTTGKSLAPATDGVACWNGSVIVPGGWRIYAKYYQMAGGSTCNWQYTAISV